MGSGRLPRVVDGRLDAADCDLALLDSELLRLGQLFDRDHQRSRLPPVTVVAPDPYVAAAVIGYTAAAPVWSDALSAIAELEAAVVVTGCTDYVEWDAAVAAPIAAWSVGVEVAAEEPPLHELARAAIDGQRRALRAVVATAEGSATFRDALSTTWDRSDEVGAFAALRAASSQRRQALVELGAAIDAAAEETTPRHATALMLAGRAFTADALASAVAEWLAGLDVTSAHPTRVMIRSEAERVCGVARAIRRNVAKTTMALTALVGMTI